MENKNNLKLPNTKKAKGYKILWEMELSSTPMIIITWEFHLSILEKFNKQEYDVNYRKEQFERKEKAQFNTDLYYEEKLEIDELLKKAKITKREFILRAMEELKKKIEDAKNS